MSGHKPWPPDPAAPHIEAHIDAAHTTMPTTLSVDNSGTVSTESVSPGVIAEKKQKPPKPPKHYQISLLVPYNASDAWRRSVWNWLERYWRWNLPGVEIVVGHDKASEGRGKKKLPFSKTTAVNDAFRRSHGDVVVILDADAYLDPHAIVHAVERIRTARRNGVKLWFVPYRRIYRLTRDCTFDIIVNTPYRDYDQASPPNPECVEDNAGSAYGHKYGALCQILPREALSEVGGMDCRFRGWGGEDVSFMKAVDTLWALHSNLDTDICHLWHPKLNRGEWEDPQGRWWEVRVWEGQDQSQVNDKLTQEYVKAYGNVDRMRALVDAGCRACRKAKGFFWRLFHPKRKCG